MSEASNRRSVPLSERCVCEESFPHLCVECEHELDELRGLWLSRLMFNPFVGWAPETRPFEQFAAEHGVLI